RRVRRRLAADALRAADAGGEIGPRMARRRKRGRKTSPRMTMREEGRRGHASPPQAGEGAHGRDGFRPVAQAVLTFCSGSPAMQIAVEQLVKSFGSGA